MTILASAQEPEGSRQSGARSMGAPPEGEEGGLRRNEAARGGTLKTIQLENKDFLGLNNIAFWWRLLIQEWEEKVIVSEDRFSGLCKKYLTTEQQIQKDENPGNR